MHDCSQCSFANCVRHPGVNKPEGLKAICRGDRGAVIQRRYHESWDAIVGNVPLKVRTPDFAKPPRRGKNGGAAAGTCASCGKKKPRLGTPGEELTAIFASLGITERHECNCAAIAAAMDADGCAKVRERKAHYIHLLDESAKQATWLDWLKVAAAGYLTSESLIDEAVKRADAAISTHRPPLIGRPIDRIKLKSHIVYHVMPVLGETEWVWRRHLQWLREVRPQFNGRLIVGIVTPGQRDHWKYADPSVVMTELDGLGAEYVTAPNDTGNGRKRVRQGTGEGVLYPRLLGLLQTDDPNQVAFYGHCKGVTRHERSRETPPHWWAQAMFDTTFRNHDQVISHLDSKGITGPMRMRGGAHRPFGAPGVSPYWFYSGTFFAMRLVDVFRRKWKRLAKHYGNVEQWPRTMFDLDTESGCVFFDDVDNLYDHDYWINHVAPAFAEWKAKHGTFRAT